MVAPFSIQCAAHGVADEASGEGCLLDPCMGFEAWVQRRFVRAVGHQFEAPKQTTPANIAHIGVLAERFGQRCAKDLAHWIDAGQDILVHQPFEDRKGGGAGHGVALIGVAMLKEA